VFTHGRAHERLRPEECRRLLGTERLGRVALSVSALPSVVPVLYRVVGNRIVFAVGEDDLYAVLSNNIVAFEVDHVDADTHEGWTVQVVGPSRPIDDLWLPTFALPGPVGLAPPDRLIGIAIDRVSGLRTVAPVASPVLDALQPLA
jgi:hypothetical protein